MNLMLYFFLLLLLGLKPAQAVEPQDIEWSSISEESTEAAEEAPEEPKALPRAKKKISVTPKPAKVKSAKMGKRAKKKGKARTRVLAAAPKAEPSEPIFETPKESAPRGPAAVPLTPVEPDNP